MLLLQVHHLRPDISQPVVHRMLDNCIISSTRIAQETVENSMPRPSLPVGPPCCPCDARVSTWKSRFVKKPSARGKSSEFTPYHQLWGTDRQWARRAHRLYNSKSFRVLFTIILPPANDQLPGAIPDQRWCTPHLSVAAWSVLRAFESPLAMNSDALAFGKLFRHNRRRLFAFFTVAAPRDLSVVRAAASTSIPISS